MNDSHLKYLQSEAEHAVQEAMGSISLRGFRELQQRLVQHPAPGWVALTASTGGPS